MKISFLRLSQNKKPIAKPEIATPASNIYIPRWTIFAAIFGYEKIIR